MSDFRQQALDYHAFPKPGKISVELTTPAESVKDLALAYSPGVAEPVREIADDPNNAYKYTAKGNMVAVISNGTAILGLGNLGPLASKPVMEGKALLFKRFAGLDSIDIEVTHRTTEEFINTVANIADTFGGINLEDIKAPECFEIEEELQIKVGAVVIDYINILANYRNQNTENTYMKIKQIAEDLRAMGIRNNWLIVTATQINRNGYNSSDISMSDVAESAGLSHTADVMLGIIQDDLMRANQEYWLKVLKIRDGEGKGNKCKLNVDYNFMRLIETDDISTSSIHSI